MFDQIIMSNYTSVTEQEGQKATREQLSMMVTRYHLAHTHSAGKRVLEVACGSGTGLEYIASTASQVVGGDIDPVLVAKAQSTTQANQRITVMQLDAQSLPFADGSFDVVLIFEAIYYLPDAAAFISEAHRVLRTDGKLIIATVNREWHGFNPSPFSNVYYSVNRLNHLLTSQGFDATQSLIGYPDDPNGGSKVISLIRKVAVQLRFIPNTMEGKERLKRIFYGALKPIPGSISSDTGQIAPLTEYHPDFNMANYKQIYTISKKN
jgi:SAM-dependent methyltransferase